MLRKALIVFSLFNAARAHAQTLFIGDNNCSNDNGLIPNKITYCSNAYLSVCSTGDSFANKVTSVNPIYLQNEKMILDRRKKAGEEGQLIANIIFEKLFSERNATFATMSDQLFNSWINYFKLLIDLAVKTKSHNLGKGACGEAAKASIANSILKQLTSGERETIQLITLNGTPILRYDYSVHVFAIYNSKPIPSKYLKGNQELHELLTTLQPENDKKPVVLCDSWMEYHDTPDEWLGYVRKGKDHAYTNVTWKEIKVSNYTIPSLRQSGMTPAQRKFLIDLMQNDILGSANNIPNARLGL